MSSRSRRLRGCQVNSEEGINAGEVRGEEGADIQGVRHDWNHPIIAMTEEEIRRRDRLKSTILSEASLRAYSSLLSKFICYVASRDPALLTDDLWNGLRSRNPNEWKKFARSYYLTKPRPPSSMVKLREITPVFIDWVSTMKKRKKGGAVPPPAAAEAVADGGDVAAPEAAADDATTDMSSSTYNSCRSAVVSLFTLFGEPSESFDLEASRIIRALKIVHSSTAQQGSIRPQKGKTPLSFENYCDLAKALIKSKTSSAVFSHTVLTTMWNLMSRVSNTVTICKIHMEWRDDALLIYFAHEKTDQTQSKPGDPRHIYANPFQPAICPILSLGMFFLIVDITQSDEQPIFSGSNQYCRFHKSLKNSFAEVMLGCSTAAYGTYSIRKGAATFASSGSTSCPSFAAISLRAGWSMGGVTSAYIHYHGAGDQHVGRTVCGLNPLHPSFAVLPPCFKEDFDSEPLLRTLFSNFDGQTPEFKKVLTMTTASVLYHVDWLKSNLDDDHPLFSTELFRIDFGRPLNQLVECRNWRPGDVLRATGVPPHVQIMLNATEIMNYSKTIPDLVCTKVVEQLEDRNQLFRNASREEIQQMITSCFQNALGMPQNAERQIAQPVVAKNGHPKFYYSAPTKASRIPPDFKLPTGNLQKAWVAYCCWDDQKNIPPLRAVFGHELERRHSARFASFRTLMEAIVMKAIEQNVWVDPTDPVVAKNVLERVDLSEVIPTKTATGRPRRLDQVRWTTLVNDFYALRQKSQQQHNLEQPLPMSDDDDDSMRDEH